MVNKRNLIVVLLWVGGSLLCFVIGMRVHTSSLETRHLSAMSWLYSALQEELGGNIVSDTRADMRFSSAKNIENELFG